MLTVDVAMKKLLQAHTRLRAHTEFLLQAPLCQSVRRAALECVLGDQKQEGLYMKS